MSGTDQSTLQTQILPTIELVEELKNKLLTLKSYSFISKQQSQFFEGNKNNLNEEEALVVLDFSENYKYVVQHASQAFHFNNNQCTVFPVVYYYERMEKLIAKVSYFCQIVRAMTQLLYTLFKKC